MSTAVAPVKTVLRLPPKKWQREVQPGLEDLGFMFKGLDATAHAIFEHPTAGQVRVAGSVSGDPKETEKQALGRARRLLALQHSEVGDFLRHLRGLYGVGPTEAKVIRLNMSEEIQTWAELNKPKMATDTIRRAILETDFLAPIDSRQGARRGDWVVRGTEALDADIVDDGIAVSKEEYEMRKRVALRRIAETGGAVAWLAQVLSEGAQAPDDLKEQAVSAGFTPYAVNKASKALGVLYEKEARYQGKLLWRLPAPKEIAEWSPDGAPSEPETPEATETPEPEENETGTLHHLPNNRSDQEVPAEADDLLSQAIEAVRRAAHAEAEARFKGELVAHQALIRDELRLAAEIHAKLGRSIKDLTGLMDQWEVPE